MANKKEEITDIISDEAYADPDFKKGLVLKFQKATIKITKVDRKNKRTWGEHIVLVKGNVIETHQDHNVDSSKEAYDLYGMPYCTDCEVPVNEVSTEDGDVKALDRKDIENENIA
jgi:hypothetical protein